MDNQILRRLQLTQLEILKEVKRICDENGIQYWLTYGTLLGAVRHKGFIPWDDDLDIGMLRKDYERFIRIAREKMNCNYFLQTWETDKGYPFPFAKVRKRDTVYIEARVKDSKAMNGIFIDIFPYDKYGSNQWQGFRLKVIKTMMFAKCGVKSWIELDRFNIKRYLAQLPIRFLSFFFSQNKLIHDYNIVATKYNEKDNCSFYFSQGFDHYKTTSLIPWKILQNFIEIPFEDESFKVPEKYDDFLRINYGDYTIPPPKEKRLNCHEVIKIQFEKEK